MPIKANATAAVLPVVAVFCYGAAAMRAIAPRMLAEIEQSQPATRASSSQATSLSAWPEQRAPRKAIKHARMSSMTASPDKPGRQSSALGARSAD